jgi:Domain of unknown function (DUF4202)
MNPPPDRFAKAIAAFDAYNGNDPNLENFQGKTFPKEVLYAHRMTERLVRFAPNASEPIRLAARCQHIGRWEIARAQYPMDKKGYFAWRQAEKQHHAQLAEKILSECGYGQDTIARVKSLVLKKELLTDPDTQLLEDIVCLVFIEFYLDDFAAKHETEKVLDIIQKTKKKMSDGALKAVAQLSLSANTISLLTKSK